MAKYFEGYRGKFVIECEPPLRTLMATAETLADLGRAIGDLDASGKVIVADEPALLHDHREPRVYRLFEPAGVGVIDHGAYASPAAAQEAADALLASRAKA